MKFRSHDMTSAYSLIQIITRTFHFVCHFHVPYHFIKSCPALIWRLSKTQLPRLCRSVSSILQFITIICPCQTFQKYHECSVKVSSRNWPWITPQTAEQFFRIYPSSGSLKKSSADDTEDQSIWIISVFLRSAGILPDHPVCIHVTVSASQHSVQSLSYRYGEFFLGICLQQLRRLENQVHL